MRIAITSAIGLLLTVGGLYLRLNAMALAKPMSATWAPGSWESTEWAFWQGAYSDIGNILLLVGLAVIAVALHHWNKGVGRARKGSAPANSRVRHRVGWYWQLAHW